MATDRNTLKGWFVRGAKPLATQFAAWIDSFWHKDDTIPIGSIEELGGILGNKADTEAVINLISEAINNQSYPEASITEKGIVQLSSTSSLTEETKAATPKLVSSSVNNAAVAILEEVENMLSQTGMEEATYAQTAAKVASGSLVPGKTYKITDRGDRGIVVRAVSVSRLSFDGVRFMLCPATYATGADAHGNNWIGVWKSTKTATVNCLAIWNGKVWKNLTGAIGYPSGENLDSTNWQPVEKSSFANYEYVEMVFGCRYDFDNDWVFLQWDSQGNVFGNSRFDGEIPNILNYCDISDWNYGTSGCRFEFNRCAGFFNNNGLNIVARNSVSTIICGNNSESIYGNSCIEVSNNSCTLINGNSNAGRISENTCPRIKSNSNAGDIRNNANSGNIDFNSNNGSIEYNQSGVGEIVRNSNNGDISYNYSAVHISNNANAGSISYNTCTGYISLNTNGGEISNNISFSIGHNSNTMSIDHCEIAAGYILNNRNAGVIRVTAATSKNVFNNFNNGDIQGTITTDITDARVDKP